MSKITIGIAGLGEISHQFAASFASEKAVLYGCASRNYQKAQEFQQAYDLPHAYHDYEEMLADPAIDAIYVGVPNLQHFDYCREALTAGKHVLCEKAITVNDDELDQLSKLAEEHGLIIQEAMTIFNMPLFSALKEKIATGQLGQLKMIQAPFGSYKAPVATNRFFSPKLGGGALLDIGTYAVSFMRYFLADKPELLATKMQKFATGVDEQSVSLFVDSDQTLATVALAFQAKMPKVGVLSLEKAYITVADYPRADTATIFYNDGTQEILTVGKTEDAMNYEVATFVSAIKTGVNLTLPLTKDVIGTLSDMQRAWQKNN